MKRNKRPVESKRKNDVKIENFQNMQNKNFKI